MNIQLASERKQRMCSTNTHHDRPATHLVTIQGTTPRPWIGYYPVCRECAEKKHVRTYGTTVAVRKL